MSNDSPKTDPLYLRVRAGIEARDSFTYDEDFAARGKCHGMSREDRDRVFFFGRGEASAARTARSICGSCPVVVDCALHMMSFAEHPYGFAGGMGARARKITKRDLGIPSKKFDWWGMLKEAAIQDRFRDDGTDGEFPVCRRGHVKDDENTYWAKGRRVCKKCQVARRDARRDAA